MNDFEVVPVTPIITDFTSAVKFHMHCISILENLHYIILSNPFSITFLSPEIATSINILSTNKTAAYSHEPSPCCKQYLQWKKGLGSVKYNCINTYINFIKSTGK
jgi:hypothetical protein